MVAHTHAVCVANSSQLGRSPGPHLCCVSAILPALAVVGLLSDKLTWMLVRVPVGYDAYYLTVNDLRAACVIAKS